MTPPITPDTADGIVPRLPELLALRAIAQGRRGARRGAMSTSGHALSTARGRGMEYAESREYARGDDARHIDWRLTARSGKAHTKLFQAERERLTLVVADTAPALYFGTRLRFKSVQAARAGALAAWVALRDGDRIAALRASASEAPVPPASGLRGALRVLDALSRWYTRSPADDAGLAFALEHAQRLLRPGSRLIVLADAASVLAVPERRWAALAAHAEVVVLLLVDPLEVSPPAEALPFAAGDARIDLALDAAPVRQRWAAQFNARMQQAQDWLRARGIRVTLLPGDAPTEQWLPLLDRAPRSRSR